MPNCLDTPVAQADRALRRALSAFAGGGAEGRFRIDVKADCGHLAIVVTHTGIVFSDAISLLGWESPRTMTGDDGVHFAAAVRKFAAIVRQLGAKGVFGEGHVLIRGQGGRIVDVDADCFRRDRLELG